RPLVVIFRDDKSEKKKDGGKGAPAASQSNLPHSALKVFVFVSCQTLEKGKVVCIKFPSQSVDETYLRKLAEPFGKIIKVIMFPSLGFVEMGSVDQAKDLVKFHSNYPPTVNGEQIEFSISNAFNFLQSSRVVSFTPAPSGEDGKSDLITIIKRFGPPLYTLFLPSMAFVEMKNAPDAQKLVDYYLTNTLRINSDLICVSFSGEYKTLIDDEDSRSRKREKRSKSKTSDRDETDRRSKGRKESPKKTSEKSGKKTPEKDSGSKKPPEKDSAGKKTPKKESASKKSPEKDIKNTLETKSTGKKTPEKDLPSKKSSDKDSTTKKTPAKKSTSRTTPENKSASRTTPENKSASKTTPENKSASKTTPENKSASRTTPENKSASRTTPENKSASKTTPENKSASRTTPENKSASRTTPENKSASRTTPENKSASRETSEEEFEYKKSPKRESLDKETPEKDLKNGLEKESAGRKALQKGSSCAEVPDSETSEPKGAPDNNSVPQTTLKTELKEENTQQNEEPAAYNAPPEKDYIKKETPQTFKQEEQETQIDVSVHSLSLVCVCFVGTEFVRPVVGYFCNLCQLIFAEEDEAKQQHCSSLSHYKKGLKEAVMSEY
uniref:Matrin-type domain-containing protein n=1 Tax=Oreochromis aureus TaxID=47969 RepID=A0A668V4M4_OREAU